MRTLLLLFLGIFLSCGQKEGFQPNKARLGQPQHMSYSAGEQILLKFPADEDRIPSLLLTSSIGSTTLPGKKVANEWHYDWPAELTENAGVTSWVLLKSGGALPNGNIHIHPVPERQGLIETYLGPKSIRVGGNDHTMLVALPTDRYDNLLPEDSPLTISRQNGEKVVTDTIHTKNGLVWKNLYSPNQSGVMLAVVEHNGSQSKELSVQLRPGNSVDFDLEFERVHDYADGHQLLTINTSRIVDQYGNTISDGTLVNFVVNTSGEEKLYAMGKTLSGVANVEFLHPERPNTWKISAYIAGISQSNTLSLEFKAAFPYFELGVSENQRIISIGPIRSFMKQLVPDGLGIRVAVEDEKGNIQLLRTSTRNGKGQLILEPELFPAGTYKIAIEIGGILRNITIHPTNDQVE